MWLLGSACRTMAAQAQKQKVTALPRYPPQSCAGGSYTKAEALGRAVPEHSILGALLLLK